MAAQVDPVAAQSGFLRMYMSNHPDTLVSYAKWYAKVTGNITSAELTAIDSQKMTLTCTFKSGSTKEVLVPFEPPLVKYDELKPRMLEMKAVAQEKLGMTKAPQITSFRLPADALNIAVGVSIMAYLALAPLDKTVYPSPLFLPARLVNSVFGPKPFLYVFYSLVTAHALEAVYAFILCRRHQTGVFIGAVYVITTFMFGFPIWKDFNRRVQAMRIDSMLKVD